MLIAVLVFMYLDKVKARDKRPAVIWGIVAGIVASMFVALGFKKIRSINIKKTADIEGVLNQKTLSIEEGAVLKIKTETYK